MEELQETVRSARTIRALGSRHSFNDIADSEGELLTLDMLPKVVDVDAASSTVRVEGAVRYGEL
jgi:xylitol oxidase